MGIFESCHLRLDRRILGLFDKSRFGKFRFESPDQIKAVGRVRFCFRLCDIFRN